MHPITPFIAGRIRVEHALLSPPGGATAADSMQMAFAASELAIADVGPFSDLTRLGETAWWRGAMEA